LFCHWRELVSTGRVANVTLQLRALCPQVGSLPLELLQHARL
jgi:hypothetical protein